jgi:nucleoside-diphosphate-sugar epimerase
MPDEAALDELLSRPTPAVIETMRALEGDLLVVGAGGKMGPTLARMALRASQQAGVRRRVAALSRFGNPEVRRGLERAGVDTLECDLLRHENVTRLPEAANVVYMVGVKFGTAEDEARTWAVNAFLPGVVADRYRASRLVAFSTGNVYPLSPADTEGPTESDPVGPIGAYAQSALARERVLEYFSGRNGTRMVFLRLNYAVEPRYGVLRDIADQVRAGEPVDLGMPRVNLIWQRDASAIALRALAHASAPPLVLNVTGRPAVEVRRVAERFAERWKAEPRFRGEGATTALLSNAARTEKLFGPAETGLDEMIARVAEWVEEGGRSLGRPTHFGMREGRF